MKQFYRCGNCRARLSLSAKRAALPKCHNCGKEDWRVDNYRHKQYEEKTGSYAYCICDAAHYNHRPGSVGGCKKLLKNTQTRKEKFLDFWKSYFTPKQFMKDVTTTLKKELDK